MSAPAPATAELIEAARDRSASARAAGGRRRVAIILAIGLAVTGGYLALHALGANRQTTDDAQIEADVVPLAPRVGGQVAAVRVADNAHVKKGDVLVEIDPADLKARLQQSEGELAAARAQAAAAAGLLDTNTPVDAKVAAARANAELANARVTTAEAALELARLNLSYATLVAPADGVISRLTVHAGQLVSPGMPVAELVPEGTYVVANFKETQVGAMKAGQVVDIEVDAFGGHQFEGVVESLSGGTGSRFSLLPPDNASGNFVKVVQRVPVRIRWKGAAPPVSLRPGMSATVTVHTEAGAGQAPSPRGGEGRGEG